MSDFDRVTKFYDSLKFTVFGNKIDTASEYFLSEIPSKSTVLVLGGGTGRLLSHFNEDIYIDFIELSRNMIERAKNQKCSAKVNFFHTDALIFEPESHYDFIITPFFLDCFKEYDVKLILSKYKEYLIKDGKWLQIDFYPKNSAQKLLVRIMYSFFTFTANLQWQDLPHFDKIFEEAHFKCIKKAAFYRSMIESKIYKQID